MKIPANKIKLLFLTYCVVVFAFSFVPHGLAQKTADTSCDALKAQINALDQQGALDSKKTVKPIDNLPAICTVNALSYKFITIFFYVAGGIAVVFIMIGGFQYMVGMSTGGEEAIAKAKKTITYALVGLVIIVLAGTMVIMLYNLITSNQTGTTGTSPGGTGTDCGTFSNPKPCDPPPGGDDPPGGAGLITYSVTHKGKNQSGSDYKEIYNVTVTGTQVGVKQLCDNKTTGNVVVAVEDVFQHEKSFSGGSIVFSSVEADSPDDISVTVCDNHISTK